MIPQAEIVHQVSGRTRLKISSMRQEKDYFEAIRETLAAIDGIEEVQVNDVTGSVTIQHPETIFPDLEPAVAALQLFQIGGDDEAIPAGLNPIQSRIAGVDRAISRGTRGVLDLRLLAIAGAVGFSVRQYKRGKLLGPAVAIVWTVADLVVHLVPPKPKKR